MIKIIWILAGAFLLASCNPVKSTAEADKAAAEFRSLYDGGDFERIFDDSHADFKAAQPRSETIDFLISIRDQLGAVKSTDRTGWQANSLNLKTNVVLTFSTEYENGTGVETFTYRIADGKAKLIGWFVNSNALKAPNPSDHRNQNEIESELAKPNTPSQ